MAGILATSVGILSFPIDSFPTQQSEKLHGGCSLGPHQNLGPARLVGPNMLAPAHLLSLLFVF